MFTRGYHLPHVNFCLEFPGNRSRLGEYGGTISCKEDVGQMILESSCLLVFHTVSVSVDDFDTIVQSVGFNDDQRRTKDFFPIHL